MSEPRRPNPLQFRAPIADYDDVDRQAVLIAAAQRGDRAAAEEVYATQSRWVVKIATRFARQTGWDADEAIAVANVAFFAEVLPKFDPSRGAKLSTLLAIALPRALRRAKNADRLIRPTSMYNGPACKHHDQVERTGNVASLDNRGRSSVDGGDLESLASQLVDRDPSPLDWAADAERRETALRALAAVEPRGREILRLRYLEHLTLSEVGERMGIVRERARQLEKRALTSLRLRYDGLVATEREWVGGDEG